MARNVSLSVLPVIVLYVICGYSVSFDRKSKLQTLLNAYCCVVTILCSVLWTAEQFTKLYCFDYTVITFALVLLCVWSTLILTHYRIKFCLRQDLNSDIFDNLAQADRSFESLRVAVPHSRNTVQCALFMVAYILLTLLFNYENHYYASNSRETYGDFGSWYNPVSVVTHNVSIATLFAHYYVMTNIIRQRVRLARDVVEKFDRVSDRNVAWSKAVTVSVVAYPDSGNFLTDVRHNYEIFCNIYECVTEAFHTLRKLYANYLCFYTFAAICAYSVDLFYNIVETRRPDFILITVACITVDVMPVFMSESIDSELQTVFVLMNGLLYKQGLRNLRGDMKRWICKFGHRERKFDCGFFNVDTRLLFITYQIITLLVFNMLSRRDQNKTF